MRRQHDADQAQKISYWAKALCLFDFLWRECGCSQSNSMTPTFSGSISTNIVGLYFVGSSPAASARNSSSFSYSAAQIGFCRALLSFRAVSGPHFGTGPENYHLQACKMPPYASIACCTNISFYSFQGYFERFWLQLTHLNLGHLRRD